MREVVTTTINQTVYKVMKLGAKVGKRALARLVRIAGPAFEAEDTMGALCRALNDADLDYFCDLFMAETAISPVDKPELEWQLKDKFDDHFSGKYGEMVLWLKACLEANYGNFLDELGIAPGVMEAMMTAAKSQLPMKTNPTSPSGASSTVAMGG